MRLNYQCLLLLSVLILAAASSAQLSPVRADCEAEALNNCINNCGVSQVCRSNCERQCSQGTLPSTTTPTTPGTNPSTTTNPPTTTDPSTATNPTTSTPETNPSTTTNPSATTDPASPTNPEASTNSNSSTQKENQHCQDASDAKYYIENNCKAIDEGGENGKITDDKTLTRHLIYDGYQAYRGTERATKYSSYLNQTNKDKALNLGEAKVPFLRNSDYHGDRLNSAENYFGNIVHRLLNDIPVEIGKEQYNWESIDVHEAADSIITLESSWLATTLGRQEMCAFKVMNMFYTLETCEGGDKLEGKNEKSCQGLYYTVNQDRFIPLTMEQVTQAITGELTQGYELKQLVQDVTSKIDEPITGRLEFCQELYEQGSQAQGKRWRQYATQLGIDQAKTAAEHSSIADKAIMKLFQEEATDSWERMMIAMDKVSWQLAQYRTGYVVQATRVCSINEKENAWCAGSDPRCNSESITYEPAFKASGNCIDGGLPEGGDCQWKFMPDQVRVIAFKYPDLFSNKNFCNQWEDDYPEKCNYVDKSDQYSKNATDLPEGPDGKQFFYYGNPITEYNDPALTNKNMLYDRGLHELQRNLIQEGDNEISQKIIVDPDAQNSDWVNIDSEAMSREAMAASASAVAASAGLPSDLQINCTKGWPASSPVEPEPCEDYLQLALVKIINATVQHNVWAEFYLGTLDNQNGQNPDYQISDYVQGTSNEGKMQSLTSNLINSPADNVVETGVNEVITYNDSCDCGVYDEELKKCIKVSEHKAGAITRYWVVMPMGQETFEIEKGILGSFYYPQQDNSGYGYLKFVADDARQRKRLALAGVKTQDGEEIPLSILGAGPVGNIFTVQASLLNSETDIYKILQGCKDLDQFFSRKCGQGESGPSNPNASAANSLTAGQLEQVKTAAPNLSTEKIAELASINPEQPVAYINSYQAAFAPMNDKYSDQISTQTIHTVVKNNLVNPDLPLSQIVSLKQQYGDVPGINDTVLTDLTRDYGDQAGTLLQHYQTTTTQFPDLAKGLALQAVKDNLSDPTQIGSYAQVLNDLTRDYGDQISPGLIANFVQTNPVDAPALISLYQRLLTDYSRVPQKYVQELVQTYGFNAEGVIQEYLDRSSEFSSRLDPNVIYTLVKQVPDQSQAALNNLVLLQNTFHDVDPEILTPAVAQLNYSDAYNLLEQYRRLRSDFSDLDELLVGQIVIQNPQNPANALQRYTANLQTATQTFQGALAAGQITQATLKQLVLKFPDNYQAQLNRYLQGQLTAAELDYLRS